MARKSVSYLTSIRLEVTDSAKELSELVFDLDACATLMAGLTAEQIRSNKRDDHAGMIRAFKSLQKSINETFKQHLKATKDLQTFF
jgi:hypothetical protein